MGARRGEIPLGRRLTMSEAENLMEEKGGIRIERTYHYPTEIPYTETLQEFFTLRSRYYCPRRVAFQVIGLKAAKTPAPVIDAEQANAALVTVQRLRARGGQAV
jgi:hypothetical protein